MRVKAISGEMLGKGIIRLYDGYPSNYSVLYTKLVFDVTFRSTDLVHPLFVTTPGEGRLGGTREARETRRSLVIGGVLEKYRNCDEP
jgi:hypothetical protein